MANRGAAQHAHSRQLVGVRAAGEATLACLGGRYNPSLKPTTGSAVLLRFGKCVSLPRVAAALPVAA